MPFSLADLGTFGPSARQSANPAARAPAHFTSLPHCAPVLPNNWAFNSPLTMGCRVTY